MPSPVQPIRPSADAGERLDKINEFGDLDLKIERLAPEMARHAVLKAEIVGWSKDEDGDKPCVFPASRWTVRFMPRENRRKIFSPKKAFLLMKKAIGIEALMALVTIPLEAGIDKHIDESEHKLFLTKTRTGPRELSVIPTEQPPKAA